MRYDETMKGHPNANVACGKASQSFDAEEDDRMDNGSQHDATISESLPCLRTALQIDGTAYRILCCRNDE